MSERAVPRDEAHDIEFLNICSCGCDRLTGEIALTLDQAVRHILATRFLARDYRSQPRQLIRWWGIAIRREFDRLSEDA